MAWPLPGVASPRRDRDHEYFVAFPNRWAFIRSKYIRDFALEALGKSYVYVLTLVVVIKQFTCNSL